MSVKDDQSLKSASEPKKQDSTIRRFRGPLITAAVAGGLAIVAALLVLVGASNQVRWTQDLSLLSLSMPREVAPGGKLTLRFKLKSEHALDTDFFFFVHVEGSDAGAKQCRMVEDRLPQVPPTKWGNQEIEHEINLTVPSSCAAGGFEVYAGLYNHQTSARLPVATPRTGDNRVHAGHLQIVSADPDGTIDTIVPKDMRVSEYRGMLRPWRGWLLLIGAASVISGFLFGRRTDQDDDEEAASDARVLPKLARRLTPFLPAIPFFLGVLAVLEFVKDDAYISFRYAHNLVKGQGLVFNMGERLEGFTNFLWVMILAPFEAMGLDLFQVCEVLGTGLGIACLVQVVMFSSWINGERRNLSQLWGAVWLSCSSSFVLWSKSGLEQPLAQLLPILGSWLLWRARAKGQLEGQTDTRYLSKMYLLAGVVMGLGCMTRPELHLMGILVGLPLVLDAIRDRKVTKTQLLYVLGILLVTVPSHVFRYAYYGTLVPNTFYVKTSSGSTVWIDGLRTLNDMFKFNLLGMLVVFAALAFANRRRLVEKSVMALICVSFMVYYVKVGVDEMHWHRLYLPALPFLTVLAALGAQNLLDGLTRLLKQEKGRLIAYLLGWCLVGYASFTNFSFTFKESHGFDGHGDLAGTFHPDLGKFLVRHEKPGALVAFQDMGSTPYHAPDINFLDFIGLVDGTIAHARHDHGLHAFLGNDGNVEQANYDAEMREYYWRRNPEWAILTIYTSSGDERRLAEAFGKDPGPGGLGDTFNNNPYQFKIYADPRFRQRYVHVRTWQRSLSYYLSLWRRKDLYDQTPGEVVLDAVPANAGGVKAKFERGIELMGTDLTRQTLERHEVFLTSWWKLPGPMESDLTIFVHVTKAGFQAAGDHIPGDWMYPADRWKAGQIIEDRTLFQLPPFEMKPGTYSVYLGLFRRSTGERLKVVEGPNDGQDRVLMGSFEVNTLFPLIHQLIPPTRVDVMRKYPERIVNHGR